MELVWIDMMLGVMDGPTTTRMIQKGLTGDGEDHHAKGKDHARLPTTSHRGRRE